MKTKALLLFFFSLAAVQCKYENLPVIGIITGYDARLCPCCGGLMINLNNETKLYEGNFYLIDNTAADLGIPAGAAFPIYAQVTYTQLDRCPGNVIHLDSFTKIK